MRFVVLALAVVLAIGADAASIDPYREQVQARLATVKQSLDRILDKFEGTELAPYKAPIKEKLEAVQTYLQMAQQSVAPKTDAMYTQILDATKDVRESVSADMTQLQSSLDPKILALRTGLEEHIKEYMATVKDVMTTQMTKQQALMAEMQPQWGPVLEKLRADIATNWEETRERLRPINDDIASFVSKYAQMAHGMVAPYYQEFRDQATASVGRAREADTTQVQLKLKELGEALQAMLQ